MEDLIKTKIVNAINANKNMDKGNLCHKIEIELINGTLDNNIHIPIDEIASIYEEVMNPVIEEPTPETPITEEV